MTTDENTMNVLNPDVSLAELYQRRAEINQKIIKNYANGGGGNIPAFLRVNDDLVHQFDEVQQEIEKVEKAGTTGGVIRII